MEAVDRDQEQLRLLSVFHYVVAGLAALFSLLPLLYLAIGVVLLAVRPQDGSDPRVARVMAWFLILFATLALLCGAAFTVCLLLAGRYLGRRTHYLFCMVVAGIACIFMPFGTVLGVFTIVVLQRDSVMKHFGRLTAPPASP